MSAASRASLWRGAAAAALAALALASVASAATGEDRTTATIAAWNIKRCITAERAVKIAEGLRDLDADLIALSEVEAWHPEICGAPQHPDGWDNSDALAAILSELGALGGSYLAALPPQASGLDLALVWRAGVVEVGEVRLVEGTDLGSPRHRQALVASARIGDLDLVILGLHLKSGRGSSERTTRARQVEAISDFAREVMASGEGDVLIVGDYNMVPGQDDLGFKGLRDGGNFEIPSYVFQGASHIRGGSPGNLLDGYAISRGAAAEYVPGSAQIVPLHTWMGLSLAAFEYRVSDHLPLAARFRIRLGDDD